MPSDRTETTVLAANPVVAIDVAVGSFALQPRRKKPDQHQPLDCDQTREHAVPVSMPSEREEVSNGKQTAHAKERNRSQPPSARRCPSRETILAQVEFA
jgi:hypothetical protein